MFLRLDGLSWRYNASHISGDFAGDLASVKSYPEIWLACFLQNPTIPRKEYLLILIIIQREGFFCHVAYEARMACCHSSQRRKVAASALSHVVR